MKQTRELELVNELMKRHRNHQKKPVVCEGCGRGPHRELPFKWFQVGRSRFKALVEDQLAAWCPHCAPDRKFA